MTSKGMDSLIPKKKYIQLIQDQLNLVKSVMLFFSEKDQIAYLNEKAKAFFEIPNSTLKCAFVDLLPELNPEEVKSYIDSKDLLENFELIKFNSKTNQFLKLDFIKASGGFFLRIKPLGKEKPTIQFQFNSIELLNFLNQGVLVFSDQTGKVSFINKYFSELVGWDPYTFIGFSKEKQFDLIRSISKDLFEVFDSKNLTQKQVEISGKNGVCQSFQINPIQFDSPDEKRTVIVMHSVKDFHLTQNEPNGNQSKFPPLFDKFPEGILIQNHVGEVIYVNPAAENILDFDKEKILGKPFNFHPKQIIQQDGSSLPFEKYPHVLALNSGKPVEKSILGFFNKKTKSYTWIQSNTIPEFQPGESKPYQIFNSFKDISEKVNAEKKVEQQKELLKLMVSTSTSYINIPEDKLSETIQISLGKLGEYVEADRMYIFDYNWKEKTCSNTFEWCAKDIEPQIEILQEVPLEGLEDWTETHLSGNYMYVKNVQALNPGETLRQILEPQGIKSILAMPIMDNQHCLGFIGLDSVRKHHDYSDNEINLLNIFSGIVANVSTRLKRERDLKERIKELKTIFQISTLITQKIKSNSELFQKIVDLIPPGFFIPEETSARLVFRDQTYISKDFKESKQCIEEKISLKGKEAGVLQVFIPNHKKFLLEEFTLIKTITNTLDQHLEANENLIKIKTSETRLRNLLNSQTSFVLRTDLTGNKKYWNKKYKDEFKWLIEKHSKNHPINVLDLICNHHQDRVKETLSNCIKNPGKIFKVEIDKLGKEGKTITVLAEYCALVNENGIPYEIQSVGIDITDRKRTQQKLEESERRLIQVTDHSGSVVWETNKDGLFTYMSSACERILGYHPDELINKKYYYDLFPPSFKDQLLSIGKTRIENGHGIMNMEIPIQKKNKDIIWVTTHGVAEKDKNGNTIKVLGVHNDITERKIQERQIKDQNDRLKAIVEAIPDILYVLDDKGNYLEYYGSSIHNEIGDYKFLVGKNIKEAFNEQEAELHLFKIQRALKTGNVETYEYPGITGQEKRFFESRIIRMSPNKVLRFVREITDRKNNELEIKKLYQAVEQSPVAIAITGLKGEIEYLNPTCQKLIDESDEKISDTRLSFLSNFYSNTRVSKKEEFWKKMEAGIPFTIESQTRKINTDELFWQNVTVTPIQDENNIIINLLVIIQDVTEQKTFENKILELNLSLEKRIEKRTKELRNSNLELKKAQLEAEFANQAKSEFLSRMSHELRTPMNSILGFAQLLKFTDLKASQKRNLDFILKSGDHLLNLINEVLDISRIESGMVTVSLETIDLNGLIEEVAESVMPAAISKSISIHYPNSDNEFFYVKADLQRLKQIFINLINNAIKYNKENGVVTITYENLHNNKLKVHIKDTGIGISEVDIPKLFKPFERASNTNSSIEGTGLGLSVVQKLAKLMDANVGFTSELGLGSDFWIELPVVNESFEILEKEIKSEPYQLGSSAMHHLLLIEDNKTNIELISELLYHVKPKCQVHSVINKSEAISLAKKLHPSLILLDLNLPEIHGSEILDSIKTDSELKDIPIVIVSADATAKQIEAMIKKGAEHYVTKPINVNDMIKIFDDYLP